MPKPLSLILSLLHKSMAKRRTYINFGCKSFLKTGLQEKGDQQLIYT
jgi:hypothetical protein